MAAESRKVAQTVSNSATDVATCPPGTAQRVEGTGPDIHGSVKVISCPWCGREHFFNWNQAQDDRSMIRPADCHASRGGVLIIELRRNPPKSGDRSDVPLVQPGRKKAPHRSRKAS